MSTEQITEETTELQVDQEDVDLQEYRAPAISIVRTLSIGEHSDSTRVEIRALDDFSTEGGLVVVLKEILRIVVAERDPAQKVSVRMATMTPDLAGQISDAIRSLHGEQIDVNEASIEDDGQVLVRALILKARSDKAAADAAEPEQVKSPPTGEDETFEQAPIGDGGTN